MSTMQRWKTLWIKVRRWLKEDELTHGRRRKCINSNIWCNNHLKNKSFVSFLNFWLITYVSCRIVLFIYNERNESINISSLYHRLGYNQEYYNPKCLNVTISVPNDHFTPFIITIHGYNQVTNITSYTTRSICMRFRCFGYNCECLNVTFSVPKWSLHFIWNFHGYNQVTDISVTDKTSIFVRYNRDLVIT